jgi:hypothetical protein
LARGGGAGVRGLGDDVHDFKLAHARKHMHASTRRVPLAEAAPTIAGGSVLMSAFALAPTRKTRAGRRRGGFVGAHMCERLLRDGYDVLCVNN